MDIEQILKDAFDYGWNASHDCATSFDKQNALNNFMAQTEVKKLLKHSVMQGCQCKDRIGETKVWCCNQCGLPCEDFWLPTHYTVGSRTVGKAGEDASVRDGK